MNEPVKKMDDMSFAAQLFLLGFLTGQAEANLVAEIAPKIVRQLNYMGSIEAFIELYFDKQEDFLIWLDTLNKTPGDHSPLVAAFIKFHNQILPQWQLIFISKPITQA